MNKELILAVEALNDQKGVDPELLYETIETAIEAGLKKKFISDKKIEEKEEGIKYDIDARLDRESGDIKVFQKKEVVLEITDEDNQILESKANEEGLEIKQDEDEEERYIEEEIYVDTKIMGRMIAQTAKQIITQKIREVERNNLFDSFTKREKELITGIVSRITPVTRESRDGEIKEGYDVFLTIGNSEFILDSEEQVPGEKYSLGEYVKVYVVGVKKTTKSPVIILSRKHKGLVRRLFEQEIPEIFDGTVVIKDIAREAGYRTKVSVYSTDENVDPIGACIGPKGARISKILKELGNGSEIGEKIDIIQASEDIGEYIANSLAPAKIIDIRVNSESKEAKVLVNSDIFSLAIGKDGQNVRLAAKLTSWKIDIVSTEKYSSLDQIEDMSQEG